MKFSFTKIPESDFFIKYSNLTKTIWRVGREGGGLGRGMA